MRPVRAKGNFRSRTFTLVSSVPITFDPNRTFFAATYSGLRRAAHCAIQPPMLLRERATPYGAKICSCRYNGKWSAHLLTITCASRLAPAILFSIGCGGLPAVRTVHAHAYFKQASSLRCHRHLLHRQRSPLPVPFAAPECCEQRQLLVG